MARTDGREVFGVVRGSCSLMDLSRSMPGEEARFAARECILVVEACEE